MRGLRNLGNGKVELVDDLPTPKPGDGEVLVKIKASAVCGSELGAINGDNEMDGNSGHECMGIVQDPNGSTRVEKGQRVGVATLQGCGTCMWCDQGKPDFCDNVGVVGNTHSEFVVSKERWLLPLPDDITDVEGVLLAGDGLGVPWGASVRGEVEEGNITCVLGCGAVGLGNLLVHRYLGAQVIAVDINPKRLDLAEQMGAWKTINAKESDVGDAMMELTDGVGPDVCIEACGQQATLDAAIKGTKPGGTIVQCGHGEQSINPQHLICRRNLRLVGNWVCHFCEVDDMMTAIRRGLRIRDLVTGIYPLEEAQTGYDRFIAGEEAKIVFTQ
ncbi:MAG: zinc-binding dehydrogenase [Planctomycetes bacterium]|nr:zinc-binding dehydrogenase [Planctomycetota bacterium]